MPTLAVNGVQMYFEHLHPIKESLTPEPILLLAGMASDSASWQPVVAGLQQHNELLIPDNRCTGRTEPIPVQTSRELMIGDVLALLDNLGVDRVRVIGHSMGGMLAWALAATAPDRVTALLVASALPTLIPARLALFKSLAALRTEGNESDWLELFFQFLFSTEFFKDPAVVKGAVATARSYPYKQSMSAFSQQVSGLKSFIPELDLSAVSCPITAVTGSRDILMTPEMLTQFSQLHPQIGVRIVEHAAHAIHWEQPDAFLSIALDALNGMH